MEREGLLFWMLGPGSARWAQGRVGGATLLPLMGCQPHTQVPGTKHPQGYPWGHGAGRGCSKHACSPEAGGALDEAESS